MLQILFYKRLVGKWTRGEFFQDKPEPDATVFIIEDLGFGFFKGCRDKCETGEQQQLDMP